MILLPIEDILENDGSVNTAIHLQVYNDLLSLNPWNKENVKRYLLELNVPSSKYRSIILMINCYFDIPKSWRPKREEKEIICGYELSLEPWSTFYFYIWNSIKLEKTETILPCLRRFTRYNFEIGYYLNQQIRNPEHRLRGVSLARWCPDLSKYPELTMEILSV